MPVDNFIARHWQEELKAFHQNYLLLKQEINPEAVHDLRVAVKKLRSYLKLYTILFKERSFKETFEKTKELFSVFGRHRNTEISKQLLLSFAHKNKAILNAAFVYLQLLQEQVTPYCQQIIQQYEEIGLVELTTQLEQDLQSLDTEETANKVKDIIVSSLEDVKHNLKHFQKKSHLVRKLLKDIFYWLKILPDGFVFTNPEIKTINKILDNLGNIQDHEVLMMNLKNFRKIILSNGVAEYDLIKKIENRANKRKNTLLENANRATGELIERTIK